MPIVVENQLKRIEGLHRGFLYQHLVGVGCILTMSRDGATAVLIEHDEDIEVHATATTKYIQVKNLGHPLRPSDIKSALKRFAAIRERHRSGDRQGSALLIIASSSDCGPMLEAQIDEASWPDDVTVLTPSSESEVLGFGLAENVVEMFETCVMSAVEVPLSQLSKPSLVWKLAAIVQAMATGEFGEQPHLLSRQALPELFEQIGQLAIQLPEPPTNYRPLHNEPPLQTDKRVRIISGIGGSGKTTWVAEVARHAPAEVVCINARETTENVSMWVARHLIQTFLGNDSSAIAEIMRAGLTGEERLRLCDQLLEEQGRASLILVDDAHRLPRQGILEALKSTSYLQWILLSRPHQKIENVAASFGVSIEELCGWSPATISAVLDEMDVRVTPEAAVELAELTMGAPLFVLNAGELAVEFHNQELGSFLRALTRSEHPKSTTLEQLITQQVLDSLTPNQLRVLEALSDVTVGLSWKTILKIGNVVLANSRLAAECARTLNDWHIMRSAGPGQYRVHDAYQTVVRAQPSSLTDEDRNAVAEVLSDTLQELLSQEHGDFAHLLEYLRVLSELGDASTLIGVASGLEEWWREHGFEQQAREYIEQACRRPNNDIQEQFLLNDCLAFFALQQGDLDEAERRVAELEQIASRLEPLPHSVEVRLATKHVLLCRLQGDLDGARQIAHVAAQWPEEDALAVWVIEYNLALTEHESGNHLVTLEITSRQISNYFALLEIAPHDVFGATNEYLSAKLGERDVTSECRHLADCLFLRGRSMVETEQNPGLDFLWANKFYNVSHSPISAANAAFEAADAFLQNGDATAALQILEDGLLPALEHRPLVHLLAEVRSHYALTLACLSRFDEAASELDAMRPYYNSFSPEDRDVFSRRERMVQQLVAGDLLYIQGQNQPWASPNAPWDP